MSIAIRVAQVGLVLVLVVLWWFHVIHAPVSDYVGAHFPFPARGSALALPAVAVQVALIEALVCVPIAALLVFVLRSESTVVAVGLAAIFALRVAVEVLDGDHGRGKLLLALFHVTAQTVLLIGSAVVLRRLLLARRRRRP